VKYSTVCAAFLQKSISKDQVGTKINPTVRFVRSSERCWLSHAGCDNLVPLNDIASIVNANVTNDEGICVAASSPRTSSISGYFG